MTAPIVNSTSQLQASIPVDIADFLMISSQEVARSYVKNSLQPLAPQNLKFTNTSMEYELKVVLPEGNGVEFEPNSFSLAPNTFLDITMRFNSPVFETFELGTNRLNFPVLISSPTIPTQPSGQWVRYLITPQTSSSERVVTRVTDEIVPNGGNDSIGIVILRRTYAKDITTTISAVYDYFLEGGPTSIPKPPSEGGETSVQTSEEYLVSTETLTNPSPVTASPGTILPSQGSGGGSEGSNTSSTGDDGSVSTGTIFVE